MAFFAVEGLTMRFGGLTALDDVSFEVERATICSVIGPNGSGKSTAFNCISGIHRPTAGTVHFEGERISGLSCHRIARRGIARTFQNIELFGNESTIDNLMLGRHQHMTTGVWRGLAMVNGRTKAARDECENRERVQHILELLDLEAVRERPVRELPYGTQKRVELARALAFPTDNMDGWEPEVVEYMRDARLPMLRFPGGNFVSGYHWEDGVGPLDGRPPLPNPAWHGAEWNHVGTSHR